MPDNFDNEPPINPQDDDHPSGDNFDLSYEPPVNPDDTNPSKSQQMQAVTIDEPPITLEDTNPSIGMRPVDLKVEPPVAADDTNPSIAVLTGEFDRMLPPSMPVWRRAVGVFSLLGAMALTAIATALILIPPSSTVVQPPTDAPDEVVLAPTNTLPPNEPIPTSETVIEEAQNADSVDALPTVSAEQAGLILQQPIVYGEDDAVQVIRNPYAPFTVIPDRPRGEIIQYIVESGDTISSISEKFGITPESLVWANDRNIVGILRPGTSLNIVPVDGVYVAQHVGDSTIADYAVRYGIDDPFEILDSEYNPQLRGLTPQSIPDSGTPILIPGGEAEQIAWNPTVEREPGSGGGAGAGGGFITFAPGEAGSCGRVAVPPAAANWTRPLTNYTWMRGFTSFHTGVDVAASVGTPIAAANSGRVVFSGWNSYGYGQTVVLAHGSFTTLYGHMSSRSVSCGQDVSAGSIVGAVGNTGNSSGPHLHFEIRFNDQPQDPTTIIPF
ncbi:MAG: LysM peptidoglycan-binding domain-containing M23 family metallopeptidase [Chloroflexota bacterium]